MATTTGTTMVIRHPKSGEPFAALIGPSDFYNGEDRILEAGGPLPRGCDPRDWLADQSSEDSEDDAAWLSNALGATIGEPEAAVYGDVLHGLLAQYRVDA